MTRSGPRISIVVADKHRLVLQGLRLLLEAEPDFSVVGEASDEAGALRLVKRLEPRVLVVCPEIGGSGLEVARHVAERSRTTRVVLVSMYGNGEHVVKALRSGASGYVLKDSSAAELVRAIRQVASGRRYLSRLLAQSGVEERLRRPAAGVDGLTKRQTEILPLAAEGLSSTAIGRRLGISPRTAEAHRASVMRKLGLDTRTDLIRYALQHGILPLREEEPHPPEPAPRWPKRRRRTP